MITYLATGNRHKAEEFIALNRLHPAGLDVRPGADLGSFPAPAEDGGSFEANARIKARAWSRRVPPGAAVLADDSGLCVDALGGRPGVDSAVYAGPGAGDAANLARVLDELRGWPAERRTARFVCVLVLLAPDGTETLVRGECVGRLLDVPAGSGGFGYDPAFVPAGEARTFGELPAERKHALSHRAQAWRELARRRAG